MAGRWRIDRQEGTAQALHDQSAALLDGAEPSPAIRILDVVRPSVVLGSSQGSHEADGAAALGLDVAQRRSGGGAVLLAPGQTLWVDLVVPAGHPWWSADVGRAAWPVGEAWAAALNRIGVAPTQVWRQAMRRTPWSSRICMAGVGAGEVLVQQRKVVGVSQRRTRRAALLQTVALLVWEPAPLLKAVGLAGDELAAAAAAVEAAATGVGADRREALEDAFLTAVMT